MSELATTYPAGLTATVDWQLSDDLRTRVLRIDSSVEGLGDLELELAVTGNGVLAHRVAPDGPSQVEMGWGSNAELDYLSAAFATVIVARSRLAAGATRAIDVLHIGTEDLLPSTLSLELRAFDETSLEILVPSTDHRARLFVGESGMLLDYEGLLRLEC
jgi:hypothetical protein